MPETNYLRIRNSSQSGFIIIDDANMPTYEGPKQGQGPNLWIRVRTNFDLDILNTAPSPTSEPLVDTDWSNVQVSVYSNEIRYNGSSGIPISGGSDYYIHIDLANNKFQVYTSQAS